MLLSPGRSFGRHLDPLDAADGGLQVLAHPTVPYGLHPDARMVDAPAMAAGRRISQPWRALTARGVVATVGRAEPEPSGGLTIADVQAERNARLRPVLPVADGARPVVDVLAPIAPRPLPAAPDRAGVLTLAGLLALAFILSR